MMEKKADESLRASQHNELQQDVKKMLSPEIMPLMLASMRRSYAHGVARIVQAKHTSIRLMWAAVCFACVCLFLFNLSVICRRLWAQEIATYFDQSRKFEFPDIYLCNNHPVAGSFHTMLNDNQIKEINTRLDRTVRMIQPILENLTNDSTHQKYKKMASSYAIHSLPYRLWADWLAARQSQTIIYAQFQSTIPVVGNPEDSVRVTPFHHHANPSCFRIELSQEAADALRCTSSDSNTGVETLIFLDPRNEKLQTIWNSQERVKKLYMHDGSQNLLPWDWSLSEWPVFLSSGLRVFLAPRGHYPSQFVANFLLSPGAYYRVSLHAEEDFRDHEEFRNECVNEDSSELTLSRFRDPYTGELRTFKYSYFTCIVAEWQRECSKLPALFNRSLIPLPNELEHIKNLTGMSKKATKQLIQMTMESGSALSLEIGKKVVEICRSKSACSEVRYKADISSAKYPGRQASARFVQNLHNEHQDLTDKPGLAFLMHLANQSLWNTSRDEQALSDYLDEAFVRLHFSVSRGSLRRIIHTKAYKFGNFVSDTGGILGLYLGMSIMVIFELVEAAYELLLLRIKSRRERKNSQQINKGRSVFGIVAGKKVSDCSDSAYGSNLTRTTKCGGNSSEDVLRSNNSFSRGDRCSNEKCSISGVALCDYF